MKARSSMSNETLHQVQQLFNQNPASMAIRRISDNMMLNANNSFRIIWLFFQRRSDWKTTLELKLFTEQEKYRVDNIINQANEVIKDFEVNVQKKKKFALDINIFAETGD
jgi:hypothetical protein